MGVPNLYLEIKEKPQPPYDILRDHSLNFSHLSWALPFKGVELSFAVTFHLTSSNRWMDILQLKFLLHS